jgi:hypothetical protein
MVTLTKNNFNLHEIEKVSHNNFKMCDLHDLSDFQAAALKWIGDALRQKESQYFWCNGAYCWYTDGRQDHEQCVWMTENGIAMFEDITKGELYRIEFINR